MPRSGYKVEGYGSSLCWMTDTNNLGLPSGGKWVAPGGEEVPENEATYYHHPNHGYKYRDPDKWDLGWLSEPW